MVRVADKVLIYLREIAGGMISQNIAVSAAIFEHTFQNLEAFALYIAKTIYIFGRNCGKYETVWIRGFCIRQAVGDEGAL